MFLVRLSKHMVIFSYRDLKPSNVLLDGNGCVKLSYFGVWEEVDHSVDPEAVDQFYCAPGISHGFSHSSIFLLLLYTLKNVQSRSHGLRQLVDDKFVASCLQTCCKLIVKTCYQQARCRFAVGMDTFVETCQINQGYYQALLYHQYTVVKTQSSIEFSNSIFLHNFCAIY